MAIRRCPNLTHSMVGGPNSFQILRTACIWRPKRCENLRTLWFVGQNSPNLTHSTFWRAEGVQTLRTMWFWDQTLPKHYAQYCLAGSTRPKPYAQYGLEFKNIKIFVFSFIFQFFKHGLPCGHALISGNVLGFVSHSGTATRKSRICKSRSRLYI